MNETILFIQKHIEIEMATNGYFSLKNSETLRTCFFILRHQMPEAEYDKFRMEMKSKYNK